MPLVASKPSVSINANPGQFFRNIAVMDQQRKTNAQAREKEANTKIFRDEQLGLQRDKLLFDQAAPERKVAETAAIRKLASERALSEQETIDNLGYSKVNTFLQNPETQKIFQNDPKFRDNPEAQLKFVTSLAQSNQRQFSDPTQLATNARRAILEGGGTQTEADAAAKRAVSGRGFNPLSETLATALLRKTPSLPSLNILNNGRGSTRGANGRILQAIPGQGLDAELSEQFKTKYKIEPSRFQIPGTELRPTDLFDLDITEKDVLNLEGEFATELRPENVRAALGSLMDSSDGTSKLDIRNLSGESRADFLKLAQAIENKRNETLGGAQGGTSNSLAEMLALQKAGMEQTNKFNSDVISRTGNRADSFNDRLTIFRNALGIPADKGTTPAKTITPKPGETNPSQLDNLLSSVTDSGNTDFDTEPASIFPEVAQPAPLPLSLRGVAEQREVKVTERKSKKKDTEQKLYKAAQKGGFKEKKAYTDWLKANR